METYVKRAVQCLVGCVRKCGDVMGKNRVASRAGIVIMKVRASMVEELDPDVLLSGQEGSVDLDGVRNIRRTPSPVRRTWSRENVRGSTVNGHARVGSVHN